MASRAAQAARPTLPKSARSLIQKAAAAAKVNNIELCKESSINAFLSWAMFSGCTNWPTLHKPADKK